MTELCRLLDGLPLAIELAAARCDVLGPAEIIARLGRQPGLLRSDDPTVSDRQHSVDETIAWSHELLSADEQRAFRRLGLFVAGFGLDASEAVVADDQLDAYDAPELVWSLVSKSLVAIEPAAGSTRYRMLETIRAFAHRQLLRSGELATVAIRLGHFYVDSYGAHLDKADVALLADRGREIDNVRGLVPTVAAHDEELAQHLACMIVVDHRRASPGAGRDEGLRLLDQLAAPTPTRVALLGEVARLAVDHGDVDVAVSPARRCSAPRHRSRQSFVDRRARRSAPRCHRHPTGRDRAGSSDRARRARRALPPHEGDHVCSTSWAWPPVSRAHSMRLGRPRRVRSPSC